MEIMVKGSFGPAVRKEDWGGALCQAVKGSERGR